MQFVKNFKDLFNAVIAAERRKVAVVAPYDTHSKEAVYTAAERGLAQFVIFGKQETVGLPTHPLISYVDVDTPDEAAAKAVAAVRAGEADVLMKGMINTDNLLRAVLNKECGILPKGNVLTHITVAEFPHRDKLLFFSDAAVIPAPDEKQHTAMVKYLADLCHSLGIEQPRIALIHCTEKTNPKFAVTQTYIALKEKAAQGLFGDVIIDGPMDLKTAVDPEAGILKGISSPIGGNADALIFPDLEAGNVFYKTISWLAHTQNAGLLVGASAPVVLPSRGDSTDSKLASLALACVASQHTN